LHFFVANLCLKENSVFRIPKFLVLQVPPIQIPRFWYIWPTEFWSTEFWPIEFSPAEFSPTSILTDENFDRQNFDRKEFWPTEFWPTRILTDRILTDKNFDRQNFDRQMKVLTRPTSASDFLIWKSYKNGIFDEICWFSPLH
jgi:hypothetical protein